MSWKKKLATYTLLTVTVGTAVHFINKFINNSKRIGLYNKGKTAVYCEQLLILSTC